VVQITTLVNAKEKPIRSERTLTALVRVGQAVNLAVERFVGVGEAIARDNPEIQREMCDACRDARTAGIYLCMTFYDGHWGLSGIVSKTSFPLCATVLAVTNGRSR